MAAAATVAVMALWTAGCASTFSSPGLDPATSPAAAVPWTPPPGAVPLAAPPRTMEIPEDLRAHVSDLSLPQVVDVALRNSPFTREAWWRARAAAAEVGIRQADLFPEIDLGAEVQSGRQAAAGGQSFTRTTYGPVATLNYLLFDFGGRRADVEAARQALIAADFLHNQAIQDVVLRVETAYYEYQGTKALLEAERTNLKEVETNLGAADERRRAGVATITDVLQARTSVAQIQLNIETLEGQLQSVRGGLAAAMGLPANLPYDVGPLPADLTPGTTTEAVEELITRALAGRPDVEAARAEALAAASDLARVRAEALPRLSAQASLERLWFARPGGVPASNLYSGALLFSYPLFDGGRRASRVQQAEADLEVSRSRVESLERDATLQVWIDYAGVRTAAQRIETSRALLASAEESERATSERYRAGVGSILDLLTAQSTLAAARAQEVQARADWLLALSQLAHDTGSLGPAPTSSPSPSPSDRGQP
jgi:TolC family type I secretion outer membrane protein